MARKSNGGVAVLGLGRFGRSLALELASDDVEVLGVDADPRIVQSLAGRLTHVVESDTTDEDAMRQLGIADLDIVVVGVGNDLESSILTASVAINLGVPDVWAKAISGAHARILSQIGVHHVVRPEHDMGRRVAHLVRGGMAEYIEFDDGYAFAKTTPPPALLNRSLAGYGVRQQYGVTVVGVKSADGEFTYATASTVLRSGDHIIVSGPRDRVEAFSRLTTTR
ncbi:potassium channel family protein [Nocardioides deserti]|uniref:TrkA family potassium uptake protein n=1 Tax=Nocardioides deserti TaxID=1588644 RepID=A0ABR6U8D2_9ACTN|nr:TrkA family potassium uptake protein [Nocardioides deserti]MBC2960628.1 TrkA family potassium uptake protein [Nocardioides deserti]GGO70822.1 potassium transporter [Nocardioides deserti]